jgi:hypothetical protein
MSSADDAQIEQLLVEARAAVDRGGSQGVGERLLAAVAAHANRQVSERVHRALTQVVSELGFADVPIFKARATTLYALRALELLEQRLLS